MASGKKVRGQKRKYVSKKISPKRENRTPELKRIFEKIKARKEKEKDAAMKEINDRKKEERKEDIIHDRASENEDASGIRLEKNDDIPQGDGNKVKLLINNFEKKNNEKKDIKKPNLINSPISKYQRKGKVDVLRKLESPKIMKADSPTRRKKTIKRKYYSNEAIKKESYSLNCKEKKRNNVQSIQKTLWDIWGQGTEKEM